MAETMDITSYPEGWEILKAKLTFVPEGPMREMVMQQLALSLIAM